MNFSFLVLQGHPWIGSWIMFYHAWNNITLFSSISTMHNKFHLIKYSCELEAERSQFNLCRKPAEVVLVALGKENTWKLED